MSFLYIVQRKRIGKKWEHTSFVSLNREKTIACLRKREQESALNHKKTQYQIAVYEFLGTLNILANGSIREKWKEIDDVMPEAPQTDGFPFPLQVLDSEGVSPPKSELDSD
jgi:hypothetical protein